MVFLFSYVCQAGVGGRMAARTRTHVPVVRDSHPDMAQC